MRKQKFNLNKWVRNWIRKNNVIAKLYVTEGGEELSIRPLEGNGVRIVATSHKRDRMFLGENRVTE